MFADDRARLGCHKKTSDRWWQKISPSRTSMIIIFFTVIRWRYREHVDGMCCPDSPWSQQADTCLGCTVSSDQQGGDRTGRQPAGRRSPPGGRSPQSLTELCSKAAVWRGLGETESLHEAVRVKDVWDKTPGDDTGPEEEEAHNDHIHININKAHFENIFVMLTLLLRLL